MPATRRKKTMPPQLATYADALMTYSVEAEHLAALCDERIGTDAEQEAAYLTFGKLLREALTRRRTWTPDRVRALYPVVREIKAEIDEVDRDYREQERAARAYAPAAFAFAAN